MLTSSALGRIWFPKFPGWEAAALLQRHGSDRGTMWHPPGCSSKGCGCQGPAPLHNPLHTPCPTPETMSSLPSLTAPGHTQVCQLGRGACPKSSPG